MKSAIGMMTCAKALAPWLILLCTLNVQAANDYVDSIHNWGSWELGINPAAGSGPQVLSDEAMNNRPANVRFRPNDNSVFNVGNRGLATGDTKPAPTPPPFIPTSGPGTAPHGGPGDRFK